MKKIYLIAFSFFSLSYLNAQFSLTKMGNEPVIGDTYEAVSLDTLNTLPLSLIGENIEWLFDGLTVQGGNSTFTIGLPSDYPNSSSYSGVTIVQEDVTNGTLSYFKTTASALELVGVDAGFFDLNYNTNTAIIANWPITYGYNNVDLAGGTISINTGTTTISGAFSSTVNTVADGTGLLNINNYAYARNGVLRVKRIQNISFSVAFGLFSGTIKQINYDFYHSTSKYPILTVNYNIVNASTPQGPFSDVQTTVTSLDNVSVGLAEIPGKEVIFKSYPNPANNDVNIHFVLTQNESYTIEVVNMLGQTVKLLNLGDLQPGVYSENINVNDLTSGVYFIKVNGKNAQGIEKLIVE